MDKIIKVLLILLALNLGVGGFILGMADKEMVVVGAMLMILAFVPLIFLATLSKRA